MKNKYRSNIYKMYKKSDLFKTNFFDEEDMEYEIKEWKEAGPDEYLKYKFGESDVKDLYRSPTFEGINTMLIKSKIEIPDKLDDKKITEIINKGTKDPEELSLIHSLWHFIPRPYEASIEDLPNKKQDEYQLCWEGR